MVKDVKLAVRPDVDRVARQRIDAVEHDRLLRVVVDAAPVVAGGKIVVVVVDAGGTGGKTKRERDGWDGKLFRGGSTPRQYERTLRRPAALNAAAIFGASSPASG